MKVILMTSDYNLAANTAVQVFLDSKRRKKQNIEVVGIIETTTFRIGDSDSWKRATRLFTKSGWKFGLKTSLLNHWQKIWLKFQKYFYPNTNRVVFEIKELAGFEKIPFVRVDSINNQKSKDFIQKLNPDYLVSALLLQKVSPEVLALPQKGAINFHPALFSQHRGTWSAFWAVFHNFKTWGATVHMMTQNFDEGKIVAQKRFGLKPDASIFSVSQKSAKIGGKLLVTALIKLKYKNKLLDLKEKALAKLFTTPHKKHVKKLKRMNRRMIHSEEIL